MGGGLPSGTPGKKQIDKVTKATRKVGAEVFEEVVEKPVKKLGKETFDTVAGTTDEERRAMLYGEMPSAGETQTPTQAMESSSAVKRSVLAGQLGAGGESAKRRKFIG
jgi:hypothetical protein